MAPGSRFKSTGLILPRVSGKNAALWGNAGGNSAVFPLFKCWGALERAPTAPTGSSRASLPRLPHTSPGSLGDHSKIRRQSWLQFTWKITPSSLYLHVSFDKPRLHEALQPGFTPALLPSLLVILGFCLYWQLLLIRKESEEVMSWERLMRFSFPTLGPQQLQILTNSFQWQSFLPFQG